MPNTVYDHRYVFQEMGYNLKPMDIQAAMGLQQIKKLPELDAARRRNFENLNEIFAPYKKYFYMPQATEKSDPCWFAYLLTIRPDAPFTRQSIVNHLEAAKIQTRSYFSGNALNHPAYHHMAAEYGDLNTAFPIAQLVTTNSFFLGTFKGITTEKLSYIKQIVDTFFKAYE